MKQHKQILIIEDSKSFAQGLELLLMQHKQVENVYQENDFDGIFNLLKEIKIDIIILDLNLGIKENDGIIISKKIKEQYPTIKIIVLTENVRVYLYDKLFNECGVDAYIDKQSDISQTYKAIETVIQNRKYVDDSISTMVEIGVWMRISTRETEILNLLKKGFLQKQIADKLFINPKTVESHIRNLSQRFLVKNTTELVAKYIKYKNANRENMDIIPPFKTG